MSTIDPAPARVAVGGPRATLKKHNLQPSRQNGVLGALCTTTHICAYVRTCAAASPRKAMRYAVLRDATRDSGNLKLSRLGLWGAAPRFRHGMHAVVVRMWEWRGRAVGRRTHDVRTGIASAASLSVRGSLESTYYVLTVLGARSMVVIGVGSRYGHARGFATTYAFWYRSVRVPASCPALR
ncbi:hypothetical protein GY45DRAFT_744875 [Cubamyces sp. BRFM 1775]|nr:hypothetical protein GY45DRAFT_744875 [Cubamyces sp. BRFM 1775]